MIRTEWKDLHRILGKASNGAEDVIFKRNRIYPLQDNSKEQWLIWQLHQ